MSAFTFHFKGTTCDCRLYTSNLCGHVGCNHGRQRKYFLFSNSNSMAGVSSSSCAVASAARRKGFLLQLGIRKKTKHAIVIGQAPENATVVATTAQRRSRDKCLSNALWYTLVVLEVL